MSKLYVLAEKPKSHFEKADNWLIETSLLSPLAKMIYLYIVSRPPGWEIYAKEIADRWKISVEAVTRGLEELKEHRVLEHKRERDPITKRFVGLVWRVFGIEHLKTARQARQSHDRENQIMENPSHGKNGSIQTHCSQTQVSQTQQTEPVAAHNEMDQELVQALTAEGVGQAQAERLVLEHDHTLIKQQIAWLAHRAAKSNRAGLLVRSIVENYSQPPAIVSQAQKTESDSLKQRAAEFFKRVVAGTELISPDGVIARVLSVNKAAGVLQVDVNGNRAGLPVERAMQLSIA